MKGTRVFDKKPHQMVSGEYGLVPRDGWERDQCWYARTPDGRLANFSGHKVVEHEDDTITVSPSILCSGGEDDGQWHGYLERGVWREC